MGVEIKKPGMLRKVPILRGGESTNHETKEQAEDVGKIRPVPKQKFDDEGRVCDSALYVRIIVFINDRLLLVKAGPLRLYKPEEEPAE